MNEKTDRHIQLETMISAWAIVGWFTLYHQPYKTLDCLNLLSSQRTFLPFLYIISFCLHRSHISVNFNFCVRMDEKQLGHLNSFLIIVWKTQIGRSNLHLDCFSRTKLINSATQAGLLYWIPPSVTQTHIKLVWVPIISHFYDIKWRHVYIITKIKDRIWIQWMNCLCH